MKVYEGELFLQSKRAKEKVGEKEDVQRELKSGKKGSDGSRGREQL